MALRGAPELRRRLKAIKTVFKPVGKEWVDAASAEAKRHLARSVDSGKTLASVKKKNQSMTKASIKGRYVVNFIDAGTRAHDISPKNKKFLGWGGTGHNDNTHFARKVHKRAVAARPFKKAVRQKAWEEVDLIRDLVDLWNKAA